MLNTCTTPDPVTLIVSMGHLLGLLVRICLLHMTENPAFYTSLLNHCGFLSHLSPPN